MLGQIIGMVLGFMASSLIEYMLHKEYLHRNDNMHHITLHHKNYYGDSRFSKPGSAWSDIASSPAYIITNILMYLPLSVLSYFVSRPFGSAFTITAIAYTLWVEIAHFWYHSPLNSSIEKKKYLRKLRNTIKYITFTTIRTMALAHRFGTIYSKQRKRK